MYDSIFGADGLGESDFAAVARRVGEAIDDPPRLAALVGGANVLNDMPFNGRVPTRECLAVAKHLTGVGTDGDLDLAELFSFVSHNIDGDKRYNWLGMPNASTNTHAIITCTALRDCIAYDIKDCTDDVALFWRLFPVERQRLLTPNTHGARLVSAFSATTDGNRVHFQYINLNVLNRCDSAEKATARGLTRTVLFNFRSYKALLPRPVQERLHRAELLITQIKKVSDDV